VSAADVTLIAVIPGTPQQQGSKNRGRNGTMYDANRNLPAWRDTAIATLRRAAVRQWGTPAPIDFGVIVTARFVFPRPKSHYRTGRYAGQLRPDAPTYKTSAPDLDKLQRALGDALTCAGILRDDALIVRWEPVKVYGNDPRVSVHVRGAA
jgi:crossover junction endodeoxyribonuclease RusA